MSGEASPSMPMPTPSLVSLLVCDAVIDDKLTNKKSAIGIFNTIVVPQVPAAIHQLAILASLTEISGKQSLQLRLVRDSDNNVLFQGEGAVEAPNPLTVVDLLFTMQGVRVPDVGPYAFELLANEALLGRRRFVVMKRTQEGGGGAPPASFGSPGPMPPPSTS